MPKAFTDLEKKAIRERLLKQGSKLFATYGLKKTSVEELATAAGISKAAFYLFYESKEALFMDVVELAEADFRRQVLDAVEPPGPTPRARLVVVLKKAFTLWRTVPLFQMFTRADYEMMAGRVPAETLQEHLRNDQIFIEELVARCRAAGIPILMRPEALHGLVHALFFVVLHEDDLGPGNLSAATDTLIELVAAFCLGEVTVEAPSAVATASRQITNGTNGFPEKSLI
jgi:AcrR family transcriptional regulator